MTIILDIILLSLISKWYLHITMWFPFKSSITRNDVKMGNQCQNVK